MVTSYPWITILVLLIVTVGLGAGATRRAAPPETRDILPPESAVAQALAEIDESFGDTGQVIVVTLLFRGDAFTPNGLSQMDNLIDGIITDPKVHGLLVPDEPVFAPSLVLQAQLGVDDFESVTQADIDSSVGLPPIQPVLAATTGTDAEGAPIAIAVLRLRDTGDERVAQVEWMISELAGQSGGPLKVSSISPAVIEDEYQRATQEGMGPLVGLALLLIAALILLFLRTVSDLLLTLAGLVVAIIWITGAEGWLGPNALGLTGPPNSLTSMVPIVVIGLTVDYAIQIVSHYREQRSAGEGVVSAAQTGLRHVTVPLALAAVTTMVSLSVSRLSPIEIVGDFGIVGALGVGLSLLVMLTLVPAGRTIIDRRREARGTLKTPTPIANALPGVSRAAGWLGKGVTRRPTPYIMAVLAVTVGLGWAATGLESEFSIRDILPKGGRLLEDLNTLDEAVGGSTEMYTVLVKAEATDTRTLLSLQDLTTAFQDETRPPPAAGPIQSSYELLIGDWTHDSGEPGDKYDPELEGLLRRASSDVRLDQQLMQELLDKLESQDAAMGRVLVNNPEGVDTILFQFPAYSGNPMDTRAIQQEIASLWSNDADTITGTSETVVSVAVTDAITEQQTTAISTTIVAALTVLALFFWVTVRQPGLAFIAVGPIVLVLVWVLGTMALLGIPYTLITSIITALSIGIGVDYTIHVIHRYRDEYSLTRDPEQAAIRTLSTTGSALLGSALTTALGLGVLVFSPLAGSQQFAITAAVTIAYSLVVSILVVPPAMTVWGSYQNVRLRSKVERWADEVDEVIDAVHRRYE